MKKINLLFTIYAFRFGGAEKFVLNLIRHLDHKKFRIVVFSDSVKDGPMREDFERVCDKIIFAQYHRYKHPFKFKKQLHQIITSEKIDIIHTNDDLNAIFPMLAKPKTTKIIVHSHNTSFKFSNCNLANTIFNEPIRRYLAKHSDCRLSCSDPAGKAFFRKRDYTTVQNGIELDKFKYSKTMRSKLRGQHKITNGEVVLMNIGRLEKVKNQVFLIRVFSEYLKLNPKSHLMIIGNGTQKRQIIQKAKDLKINDKVTILSDINNISDYYNMADLFIMPSLYEGMPVVSIEAQANGLKCVFSDTITSDADHTGSVTFLSLRKTPSFWAKEISKTPTTREHVSYVQIKQYDINYVAGVVGKLYAKCGDLLT